MFEPTDETFLLVHGTFAAPDGTAETTRGTPSSSVTAAVEKVSKAAALKPAVPDPLATPTAPAIADPVSGLLLSTWRDTWTFCKATAKYGDLLHWAPWLGGVSAVLTAVTAMELFRGLQDDTVSTTARVLVASVMVISTIITALQTWTATRIKSLDDQCQKFHALHRKIHKAVEQRGTTAITTDQVDEFEIELAGIRSGMVKLSNRAWDAARRDVRSELDGELQRLGVISSALGK